MQVLSEPRAFSHACDEARRGGRRVGLVPTMGNLHAGHLSLVDAARRHGADSVAVTVFVNPLQFGPTEDFARYPRTLERDLDACRTAGVELVFAPSTEALYPPGFATRVTVAGVTAPLEGAHRPGHFDGVATVVAKLFSLTGPSVAVFGRKDYQQLRVIERLARDLFPQLQVVGEPIVREPDGLALSSRNQYLTPPERARALALSAGLRAAAEAFARGERRRDVLVAAAAGPVRAAADAVDYVALADAETLAEAPEHVAAPSVLLVAARIGATRLIDNVELVP